MEGGFWCYLRGNRGQLTSAKPAFRLHSLRPPLARLGSHRYPT